MSVPPAEPTAGSPPLPPPAPIHAAEARPLRSAAAVVAGLVVTVALSLGTDQLMRVFGIFPPIIQPMRGAGLFLLALAYRIVFNVAGCFVAAKLAPRSPMAHAIVLGAIGLVLSGVGVAVAMAHPEIGPSWYAVALVVVAIPCAWLGGALARFESRPAL